MTEGTAGYRHAFKSSSIMGVAQAIQYAIGFLRTKVVALLLGPEGVGIVGMYLAVTSVINTASGLGLNSSGVRAIAEAQAAGDATATSRAILTMRRATWFTGAMGGVALVLLSAPLSEWSFGSREHASSLAALAALVLFTAADAGEGAVLQGSRRVGDLAARTIAQAVIATIVTLAGYSVLGAAGIVPVLVAVALTSYVASYVIGRRVPVREVSPWSETAADVKAMIGLGLAFMWSSVCTSATTFAVRALVVRRLDLESAGFYQAAWSLSGMFAALVLSAMSADYYPRLAAAARDDSSSNTIVNQQTEIGIVLAIPGLLGTLTLAPWVIRVAYSSEFGAATPLLPWFTAGVLGKVVSWPMSFIFVARRDARTYALLETGFAALHLGLVALLLPSLGLEGTAVSFAIVNAAYACVLLILSRRATGFRWSSGASRLVMLSAGLTALGFAVHSMAEPYASIAGASITFGASLFCSRWLGRTLGRDHRLIRAIERIPAVGRVLVGSQEAPRDRAP